MKFYRHYKNKPYKFLGLVKHSETLEDLALYECRYDNPTGKIWVRPRDMFFEKVVVAGVERPRFEKVEMTFQNFLNVESAQIDLIAPLIQTTLGEWNESKFLNTLKSHQDFYLQIVICDQKPVGFKLGYREDELTFYSWLGGVLPEYQGLGIATELMKQQHEWCVTQNYRRIKTKTMNRFKEMLVLNIQHGFEVVSTHLSEKNHLKINLEKKLN